MLWAQENYNVLVCFVCLELNWGQIVVALLYSYYDFLLPVLLSAGTLLCGIVGKCAQTCS